MLQITQRVSAVRRWTEERQGWPCRRLDGRLAVGFSGEECLGIEIGWDEFQAIFCAQRAAFACDDDPAARVCFVGPPDEARRFLADMQGWAPRAAAAPGSGRGSAILPPGELAGRPRTSAGEIR